jgi:UDP-N-acetylglucosamine acyltransferase
MIHPTAIVETGAQLGADCEVMAYAVVTRHCVLGDRVVVWPHAVLGGDPQDLKFDRATDSTVRIGSHTVVREHSTVHRATRTGGATVVGENCFLMAGCHVGHDSTVGDRTVLANAVLLGGHVGVGASCFIGGGAALHQHVRVGEGAMVGGLTALTLDQPPFTLAIGRNGLIGLNLVGLKRRGTSREAIEELKQLFQAVCCVTGSNPRSLAASLLPDARTPEGTSFMEFFAGGTRGFVRARRSTLNNETSD